MGVTAIFAMVLKFEESVKKSTRELAKRAALAFPPETRVNKRLLTSENSALSSLRNSINNNSCSAADHHLLLTKVRSMRAEWPNHGGCRAAAKTR